LRQTSTLIIMNHSSEEQGSSYGSSDSISRLSAGEPRQNLPLAIIAGLVSSLVGAAIWAGITVATSYQIGYIAIAIGFMVGFAVRFTGHGYTMPFAIVGAFFALMGCVVGNFLSALGFLSIGLDMSFFTLLKEFDYSLAPELMEESFHPMDLLFYGIALWAGFKYSLYQEA